jgi:hypothetical protein
LPVKPATQTNAIEQPSPQIYWLSTAKLKIGVSQQALATFRRKNTFSEAALVRCGRNGVVFAVQFRLLSSIKRDREVGHSGSL